MHVYSNDVWLANNFGPYDYIANMLTPLKQGNKWLEKGMERRGEVTCVLTNTLVSNKILIKVNKMQLNSQPQ